MALIYEVPLHPSKMELLARWLPAQSWFRGMSVEHLERVGSFRFDDPDGEVGIEVLLIAADTTLFQVPLTYRGAPLAGKDEYLVGTLEHAVLGERWVYDGPADPVYITAMKETVIMGMPQAEQFHKIDGHLAVIAPTVQLEKKSSKMSGTHMTSAPDTADTNQDVEVTTEYGRLRIFRKLAPSAGLERPHALMCTLNSPPVTVQLAFAG